jgi:hypothetical protein
MLTTLIIRVVYTQQWYVPTLNAKKYVNPMSGQTLYSFKLLYFNNPEEYPRAYVPDTSKNTETESRTLHKFNNPNIHIFCERNHHYVAYMIQVRNSIVHANMYKASFDSNKRVHQNSSSGSEDGFQCRSDCTHKNVSLWSILRTYWNHSWYNERENTTAWQCRNHNPSYTQTVW